MKKVAVIGAGIFGASAALELARDFDVTLFEKSGNLLGGASTNNHLRHHYGYHYPRSKETALESIRARKSFEEEYGECVHNSYSYYAVEKDSSKTSAEGFLKFCDELELPYELAWPEEGILDKSKLSLCIKTPEPAYDPEILRGLVEKKIKDSKINLELSHEVIEGKIDGEKKVLKVKHGNDIKELGFDYVVCALYSNFNQVNKWFGFPRKKAEYALMELIDVELPIREKFSLMVVDGDFATFVPISEKNTFRLGHVKESVLRKIVGDDLDTDMIVSDNILSNKEKILKESEKYYPVLKEAKFIRSIFVTRIIKANVENTDERLSEVENHGNGIYSIFGGKVITCVDTANKIRESLLSNAF